MECVMEGGLKIVCSQGHLRSDRAEAATGPEVKGWHGGRVHRMAPPTSLPFSSSVGPQRPGS